MYFAHEIFGTSGDDLARMALLDPQTPAVPGIATTEVQTQPPLSAARALLDPGGSAIFWIAAAAILGLILITGQFRVEAALGGRAGRK